MHLISRLLCGWRIVIVRRREFLLMRGARKENRSILQKPQRQVTDFKKPGSISSVHVFSAVI